MSSPQAQGGPISIPNAPYSQGDWLPPSPQRPQRPARPQTAKRSRGAPPAYAAGARRSLEAAAAPAAAGSRASSPDLPPPQQQQQQQQQQARPQPRQRRPSPTYRMRSEPTVELAAALGAQRPATASPHRQPPAGRPRRVRPMTALPRRSPSPTPGPLSFWKRRQSMVGEPLCDRLRLNEIRTGGERVTSDARNQPASPIRQTPDGRMLAALPTNARAAAELRSMAERDPEFKGLGEEWSGRFGAAQGFEYFVTTIDRMLPTIVEPSLGERWRALAEWVSGYNNAHEAQEIAERCVMLLRSHGVAGLERAEPAMRRHSRRFTTRMTDFRAAANAVAMMHRVAVNSRRREVAAACVAMDQLFIFVAKCHPLLWPIVRAARHSTLSLIFGVDEGKTIGLSGADEPWEDDAAAAGEDDPAVPPSQPAPVPDFSSSDDIKTVRKAVNSYARRKSWFEIAQDLKVKLGYLQIDVQQERRQTERIISVMNRCVEFWQGAVTRVVLRAWSALRRMRQKAEKDLAARDAEHAEQRRRERQIAQDQKEKEHAKKQAEDDLKHRLQVHEVVKRADLAEARAQGLEAEMAEAEMQRKLARMDMEKAQAEAEELKKEIDKLKSEVRRYARLCKEFTRVGLEGDPWIVSLQEKMANFADGGQVIQPGLKQRSSNLMRQASSLGPADIEEGSIPTPAETPVEAPSEAPGEGYAFPISPSGSPDGDIAKMREGTGVSQADRRSKAAAALSAAPDAAPVLKSPLKSNLKRKKPPGEPLEVDQSLERVTSQEIIGDNDDGSDDSDAGRAPCSDRLSGIGAISPSSKLRRQQQGQMPFSPRGTADRRAVRVFSPGSCAGREQTSASSSPGPSFQPQAVCPSSGLQADGDELALHFAAREDEAFVLRWFNACVEESGFPHAADYTVPSLMSGTKLLLPYMLVMHFMAPGQVTRKKVDRVLTASGDIERAELVLAAAADIDMAFPLMPRELVNPMAREQHVLIATALFQRFSDPHLAMACGMRQLQCPDELRGRVPNPLWPEGADPQDADAWRRRMQRSWERGLRWRGAGAAAQSLATEALLSRVQGRADKGQTAAESAQMKLYVDDPLECSELLGDIVPPGADRAAELAALRGVLSSHYRELRRVYLYYATGDQFDVELSGDEALRMMQDSQFAANKGPVPKQMIEISFTKALRQGNTTLDATGFILFLIRLSYEARKHLSKAKEVHTRFDMLLQDYLLANANFVDLTEFRQALYADRCEDLLERYSDVLRGTFRAFATAGTKQVRLLNMSGWQDMVSCMQLVDSGFSHEMVRTVFLKLQDHEVSAELPGVSSFGSGEGATVSYKEFVECIAAVSLFKYPAPWLPMSRRFGRFLEQTFVPTFADGRIWRQRKARAESRRFGTPARKSFVGTGGDGGGLGGPRRSIAAGLGRRTSVMPSAAALAVGASPLSPNLNSPFDGSGPSV
eukprot:TRINITY_DN10681_c0_g2_i1.p1 TRINITY_DN10681_c0_g2~~TRINITY_DN10681_c0_g2_i1.p1  ORF type:complete len:1445 (+),score=344.88 TRINITY_DN10681_c0_g2_i1:78-4412(+)